MSPTQTELETRLVSTLRAKGAQLPEPSSELDPDVVPIMLDEPRHPARSRILVIAAVVALVVAVAIGLAVALGRADDAKPAGEPAPEPVSQILIKALPELKFQVDEVTTEPGRNEIHFFSTGGTHSLVFDDPSLAGFVLSATSGERGKRGVVDLQADTDYTIYCSIPGHRQAGMEAVIHVKSGPPGPTKGDMMSLIPTLRAGTYDLSTAPDYVELNEGDGPIGYMKVLDFLVPIGGARPIFGEDLRTIIGHEIPNRGFVPLGRDPETVPLHVPTTTTTTLP